MKNEKVFVFDFYLYLCCAKEMKLGVKIRNLWLWVMLTTVAVVYTGKALHTHSDSYYDSLRTTRSAASNGMSDDCPICHEMQIAESIINRLSATLIILAAAFTMCAYPRIIKAVISEIVVDNSPIKLKVKLLN